MLKSTATIAALILTTATPASAGAPDRWEYQGLASTGEKVYLNLDSIQTENRGKGYFFTYQIGSDRPLAYTPCNGQFQVVGANGVTFGEMIQPKSLATRAMLERVCERYLVQRPRQSAHIFAPPSNIRTAPNGEILCQAISQTIINIYEAQGQWVKTDFCGGMGFIHTSQIRR